MRSSSIIWGLFNMWCLFKIPNLPIISIIANLSVVLPVPVGLIIRVMPHVVFDLIIVVGEVVGIEKRSLGEVNIQQELEPNFRNFMGCWAGSGELLDNR